MNERQQNVKENKNEVEMKKKIAPTNKVFISSFCSHLDTDICVDFQFNDRHILIAATKWKNSHVAFVCWLFFWTKGKLYFNFKLAFHFSQSYLV